MLAEAWAGENLGLVATAEVVREVARRILDGQSEFKVAVQMFSQAMNATLTQINQVLKR